LYLNIIAPGKKRAGKKQREKEATKWRAKNN